MALFWRYLKTHRRSLLIFCSFCVIFAVIFALYHLPMMAVVYPALLCALLGGGFLVCDFLREKRKHETLEQMSRLSAAMIEVLPEAETIVEKDYQAIISALQEQTAALASAADSRYQDMIDYYTIWVHQIKTPIASMRLNLQNEDTPMSRKLLGDLFRIEQYVEMVLAFLRMDSDSSDYVFQEYSLDGIIRQAVKKYAHEFISRKISLQYDPVDLKIVTDEKWLSFVLEQLLSNALKYTREGCVKIYLKNKAEVSSGMTEQTQNSTVISPGMAEEMQTPAELCIEDTGIGIAPEDLPRIFEKGYTGYNGRTDKKASGIGLYLCRRICAGLSIDIHAESEVGRGTVMTLRFEQHELSGD